MNLLLSSLRLSTWARVLRPSAPSPSEHSARNMIVDSFLAIWEAPLRAQTAWWRSKSNLLPPALTTTMSALPSALTL